MRAVVAAAGALAALAAFLLLAQGAPSLSIVPPRGHYGGGRVDMHTHLDGAQTQRALDYMDRYGIDVAIDLTATIPSRRLEALIAREAETQGRILTFAGFAWPELLRGPGIGERMARQVWVAKKMGARGLKIPKALGLGLPDPDGGLLAVDDPRLAPAFDAAGAAGLPVAIHVGDPVAFWDPVNEDNPRFDELSLHPGWSYFGTDAPSHAELFAAQQRLFERHPNTQFIAVHVAGFPEDLDAVDRLLAACPHVSIDIAARVPALGAHDAKRVRRFFAQHRERILFGTDFGVTAAPTGTAVMLGAPLAWPETERDVLHFFEQTWRYLETTDRDFAHPTPIQGRHRVDGIGLDDAALRALYRGNAERLLGPLAALPAR